MSNDVVAAGFKGFPECKDCQCYPECRTDCPDHLQCVHRLPEYAERVFGPNLSTWPQPLRAYWQARGMETLASRHARWLATRPGDGATLAAGGSAMTVTTQQTGKLFKAMQALGVLIMLGGVVACVSHTEAGVTGAVVAWMVGPLLYAAGRIGAWWWHG